MSTTEHEAVEMTEHSAADSLFFERRQTQRHTLGGAATVMRVAGDQFGEMHELTMLDVSAEGFGGTSDTPIEPGAIVSIGFEAPGYPARRGEVARCLPCGNGYRVAVRFENRLAA